ncbi:helix-turn-helix domain-containing protein [Streptomyces sp. NPDC048258]|uniref:helix-turn-helix domain-containing protein n=1 Tax=Streptomyces sp. NPDC048258 TaxID=3365527 RepID=UPI00371A1FB5
MQLCFCPAKAKSRRLELTLSFSDVARRTSMSYHAVRNWEMGISAPRPSSLRALAAALECQPADLCELAQAAEPKAAA